MTRIHFQADNGCHLSLVYQKHLTKFVPLGLITSDIDEEVAKHVLHVFYILRAPGIRQSDNGRESVKLKVKVTLHMP